MLDFELPVTTAAIIIRQDRRLVTMDMNGPTRIEKEVSGFSKICFLKFYAIASLDLGFGSQSVRIISHTTHNRYLECKYVH